jgi:hypothetical protein
MLTVSILLIDAAVADKLIAVSLGRVVSFVFKRRMMTYPED